MLNFGWTEKKFFSLETKIQHKYLADWLKNCYLIANQLPQDSLKILFKSYCNFFLKQEKIYRPNSFKEWQEFFSQRHHYHQKKYSPQKKDAVIFSSDFIPKVEKEKKRMIKVKWQVLLNNIRSAFNVGSIFRTMDGAGWEKALLSGYTTSIDNKHFQKAAMHTEQWIAHQRIENLAKWLKLQKLPIIGLETSRKAKNCFSYDWQQQGILILGNEEHGISSSLLKKCDEVVSIPMWGKKESLNIANAFAIVSYWITQRAK